MIECSQETDHGNGQAAATSAEARPFEQIVRRYGSLVFRVCFNVTRNAHDAEDAAQAVFLTLHKQIQSGQAIEHMAGWLQQVAYRVALDFQRGKKRRQAREKVYTAAAQTRQTNGHSALELEESRLLVAEELDQLPAKYRLPLILHYFGGLSHEEMASEMRCRPGTLRVRLFRARRLLGERLSRRGLAMPALLLNHTLEQLIFRHVSDGIIAAARSGQIGWRVNALGRQAGEIGRSALSVKAKVAVFVAALSASASTIAITQAFGSVLSDLPRKLEDKIDQAIKAAARPVMRSILPPLQASATPKADDVATSTVNPSATEFAAAPPEMQANASVPDLTNADAASDLPIRITSPAPPSEEHFTGAFLASVAPSGEVSASPRPMGFASSVDRAPARHDAAKPQTFAAVNRPAPVVAAPRISVPSSPAPATITIAMAPPPALSMTAQTPTPDITAPPIAAPPTDFAAVGLATAFVTGTNSTGSISTGYGICTLDFASCSNSSFTLSADDTTSTDGATPGTSMPEPSGLILIGLGGLLLKRRRRRERP